MNKYRCIVYERVSTGKQEKKDHPDWSLKKRRKADIESQTDYAKKFVQIHKKDFSFADDPIEGYIYSDIRSGTSLYGRVAYAAMKKRILRDKNVNALLVASSSRIGRDFDDFIEEMRFLQEHRVHVFEVKDYDSITELTRISDDESKSLSASDMTVYLMTMAMNAYSNAHLIEEVTKSSIAGVKRRIEKGIYYFGGHVQFGYKWIGHEQKYKDEPEYKDGVRDEFVIEPDEAAIVRDIFRRYNSGDGTTTIAKDYRTQGITHRGVTFQPEFIDEVLTYKGYFNGTMTIQKMKNLKQRKAVAKKIRDETAEKMEAEGKEDPKEAMPDKDRIISLIGKDGLNANQVIEDVYPAIISKETFNKAAKIRADMRNASGLRNKALGPRIRPNDATLSGLLFCACGSPMYSKGRAWYKAKNGTISPGGYQSNCHKRGIKVKKIDENGQEHNVECENSTFLPYSVDYLIWKLVMWHVKSGELMKAVETYWKNYERNDLKSQKPKLKEAEEKMREAKALMESRAFVFSTTNDEEDKKARDRAQSAYLKAKEQFEEVQKSIETDPATEKKNVSEIIGQIKPTMEFSLSEKDKEALRNHTLKPAKMADEGLEPAFMRRIILNFVAKITYYHKASDPKSPKVFMVEFKIPNSKKTDEQAIKLSDKASKRLSIFNSVQNDANLRKEIEVRECGGCGRPRTPDSLSLEKETLFVDVVSVINDSKKLVVKRFETVCLPGYEKAFEVVPDIESFGFEKPRIRTSF